VGGYELQPVLQTGNGSSTTAIRPNAVSPVGTAQDGAAASDGGPTHERSFLVTARWP